MRYTVREGLDARLSSPKASQHRLFEPGASTSAASILRACSRSVLHCLNLLNGGCWDVTPPSLADLAIPARNHPWGGRLRAICKMRHRGHYQGQAPGTNILWIACLFQSPICPIIHATTVMFPHFFWILRFFSG